MNHIEKIAAQLPEYGLDAMLITSEPGERYALGFHGPPRSRWRGRRSCLPPRTEATWPWPRSI